LSPGCEIAYKLTALFSPLPGALDGYQALKSANHVKINHAVPFSTYAESLHFGIGYFLAVLTMLMVLLRQATAELRYPPTLMILPVLCLGFLVTLQISQYGPRLTNRFMVILAFFLVVAFVQRRRNARKMRKQVARASDRPMAYTPAE